MKHKHHIVPRHVGGSDNADNIVELSIEEHAEEHRKLFEEFGRWQDECAYKLLSKLITIEEARQEAARRGKEEMMKNPSRVEAARQARIEGVLEWYAKGAVPWNRGLLLRDNKDNPGLNKLSEATKKQARYGNFSCVGDWARGKEFSNEHKANLSKRALARKRLCASIVNNNSSQECMPVGMVNNVK
jgi:hypothetical protein